ncbi:MAG: DUF6457 domain-containing protein [Actinomycetaceae bacterium]|nr:DUF6457 domain-containing protein [Actinomycetaceae bacterium]
MSNRKDDPQKMENMRKWVQAVAKELGVNYAEVSQIEGDLLGLIGKIAHGPSRPGAPLSAFLVGFSAGQGKTDTKGAIEAIGTLADSWSGALDK